MTEVILRNYFKDERLAEVDELYVNYDGEFIWFEFKLKNGQTVQTQSFRGVT